MTSEARNFIRWLSIPTLPTLTPKSLHSLPNSASVQEYRQQLLSVEQACSLGAIANGNSTRNARMPRRPQPNQYFLSQQLTLSLGQTLTPFLNQ